MTRPILALQPDHVCPSCYLTWKAARPQPAAIYCSHARVVARRTEGSWRTEPATDSLLERLRTEGAL
jgi:hypothetical protein